MMAWLEAPFEPLSPLDSATQLMIELG